MPVIVPMVILGRTELVDFYTEIAPQHFKAPNWLSWM